MATSTTAQALDLPFYRRTGALSASSHLDLIQSALEDASAPCVTCSFQASGVVLVHMLREVMPDIPAPSLVDVLHHFPATYAYRDEMARRWNLNLVNLRAADPAPARRRTMRPAARGTKWTRYSMR